MEMQLNFRSAHLYAINPAKKAGYNEILEHLGPVILPNTGPECSSVKYYKKIYIETAREKNCDSKRLAYAHERPSSEFKKQREIY